MRFKESTEPERLAGWRVLCAEWFSVARPESVKGVKNESDSATIPPPSYCLRAGWSEVLTKVPCCWLSPSTALGLLHAER